MKITSDLVDLAQGIARLAGILLFMFGLVLACCEANSMELQIEFMFGSLAMLIVGVLLARIGMEEENDC